jgi:hypothetical protein
MGNVHSLEHLRAHLRDIDQDLVEVHRRMAEVDRKAKRATTACRFNELERERENLLDMLDALTEEKRRALQEPAAP